jgi:hypothetical protein
MSNTTHLPTEGLVLNLVTLFRAEHILSLWFMVASTLLVVVDLIAGMGANVAHFVRQQGLESDGSVEKKGHNR